MILLIIIAFNLMASFQVEQPEDYVLRVVEVGGKWRVEVAAGVDECVVINALRNEFECKEPKRTEP